MCILSSKLIIIRKHREKQEVCFCGVVKRGVCFFFFCKGLAQQIYNVNKGKV